jgi:integrase
MLWKRTFYGPPEMPAQEPAQEPLSSDVSVRAAAEGEHTVTGAAGLILRVRVASNGSLTRTWIVRVADKGRRRRLGLGQYPTVKLAQARVRATDARRAIAEGIDPSASAKRRQRAAEEARGLTFGKAIDGYLAEAASAFKNAKSEAIRERALRVHFAPLHPMDVAVIAPADIVGVLRPLRPETARRAHTAIQAVFDYAEALLRPLGVIIHNPAAPRPLAALGWKRKSRKTHTPHPAVDWRIMPEVVAEVGKLDGADARCFLLIVATGVRAGTARVAKWRDIDLDRRTWTILVDDLKEGKYRKSSFVAPLNDLAIEAIGKPSSSPYVFSSSSGSPITDYSLVNLTRRLRRRHDDWRDLQSKKPFDIHGFRASLKTWTREASLKRKVATHIPTRELAELVLGHRIGTDVEQAYDRSDLLESRREIMDLWARHCLGAKIIALPNMRA